MVRRSRRRARPALVVWAAMQAVVLAACGGSIDGAISHNLACGDDVSYDGSVLGQLLSAAGSLPDADPLPTDVAGADFRLQADSPVIDAGMTLSNVPNNFRGTPRPRGSAFDIGAFEIT